MIDLKKTLQKSKNMSYKLALVDDKKIAGILKKLSKFLKSSKIEILSANKKDLAKISQKNPVYDRILLNEGRIKDMAESLRVIASYKSPIGKIIEEKKLRNGLKLRKVSVPLGVVGLIFEARPNVIIDVFALCLKSKNVSVMKGGSDCAHSNEILVKLIKHALGKELFDSATLLPNNRKLIAEFLNSDEYVDVIIPRGSAQFISFVRQNSTIPVIETGAGVVHTYFDKSGNAKHAAKIIFNAKTQRPSVCNALDTLIIHRSRLDDLFSLCKPLISKKVKIYADTDSYKNLAGKYPSALLAHAKNENFGKEYLSLQMSIKTVGGLDEAINHINTFGSGHSEAIITEDKKNAEKFLNGVDAACVYLNTSTRFTDGEKFGLGAEIGISTQKLHARGPMGLNELTSYKWLVYGNGQIRK